MAYQNSSYVYLSEDAYDRLYAEIDAEQQAEWEAEFEGSRPYKTNSRSVHQLVLERAAEMREYA